MGVEGFDVIVDSVDGKGHFKGDLALGMAGEEVVEGLAEAGCECGSAGEALGGFFGAVDPIEAAMERIDDGAFALLDYGVVPFSMRRIPAPEALRSKSQRSRRRA